MPNQSGKIVLVLVLLILVFGAAIYFFLPLLKQESSEQVALSLVTPKNTSPEASLSSIMHKEYFSEDFKMKVISPDGFQVIDSFPSLSFNSKDKKIEIIRNGTNFDNLEDYIEEFDAKRRVEELSREEELLENYPVIKREVIYKDDKIKQLSYYLYVENFVYIFSTSDKSLYPVLDQIVQSFEYKP